ncbi:MAG: ABC transporter substrate-binding protein [Acetobacteraceae bacterium]|nr:ABC transporter substrate-binding protein [Acetobacteraceae bacterium]
MAVFCLAAPVAAAPAGAQTLRMAVGAQVTALDPHYHNLGPNNAFAAMLFSTLLETDAEGRPGPGLAVAWRPVGEDAWEFRLRPGVVFHNGAKFTADDFAFTVERIPLVVASPGSFRTYTQAIRAVEVVDPLTLRIRTKGPYPLLPIDLAQVPVLNRATHAGATTDRFNSGELAIGTGPFRLASYRAGERAELLRNASYWGTAPAWQHVQFRMVANTPARLTALLAGDVDFIDQVPTADVERLRGNAAIRLSEAASLRFVYVAFDHARRENSPFITTLDGRPMKANPLQDVRVRRALSLAIDRDAIVAQVMEGVALPINQVVPPGVYGYAPALAAPRADLPAARRLLAEAGYPRGFGITLHGSSDRYPNDARIAQAVGQMWTRLGVRTDVAVTPFAIYVQRATRQEYSAFLASWGSGSADPTSALRSVVASFDPARGLGSVNRGRYSNPAFDAGLITAMHEMDPARREAMLRDITVLAIGTDVGIVPLHMQKNVWAMRPGLVHAGRIDEATRAQDVRPAR